MPDIAKDQPATAHDLLDLCVRLTCRDGRADMRAVGPVGLATSVDVADHAGLHRNPVLQAGLTSGAGAAARCRRSTRDYETCDGPVALCQTMELVADMSRRGRADHRLRVHARTVREEGRQNPDG